MPTRLVQAVVVAVGGVAGAVLRWVITEWLNANGEAGWTQALALLTVNTAGSLLLGAVLVVTASGARELVRLGLGVGFCGGLTTFSAFAVAAVQIGSDGSLASATGFVGASVATATVAVALGVWLAGQAGWESESSSKSRTPPDPPQGVAAG